MRGQSDEIRVLLFSQAPGVGGGERVVLTALSQSTRMSVVVLAHDPVCKYARSLGLSSIALELPRAHRLTHFGRILVGSWRVAAVARRLSIDVIYANGTRAMPYCIGAKLLTRLPLVAHHHGLLTTGPTRALIAALDRWADLTITPSEASASQLGKTSHRIVIRNAIDFDHFVPAQNRETVIRSIGLDQETLVVGTVTRADPRKGMNQFLDLAKSISRKDCSFLLVGGITFPEESSAYQAVESRAEELGPRIRLTGQVDDPLPYLQAMDVFVHLGEAESFSITSVEAMACGVPVVAYRWGGVVEVVSDGKTGLLVEPGDLRSAIEAVETLLGHPHLRETMSRQGRQNVVQRFGFDRLVEEITQAVAGVVA